MRTPIDRREFLQMTAMLAAAAAMPGCSTKPRVARRPGPNDRINVGIIGFGTIAHGTINNFLYEDRLQVVAVADPVRELPNYGYGGELMGGHMVGKRMVETHYAANAKGDYKGCRVYSDFRDMFDREDLDAVVINTPDHWHCTAAVLAARRGLHIYGQKPLSLTVSDGRRMADEIQKAGVTFQTGSQQRSGAYFRIAAEFVRNGRLGKITGITVGLPGGHKDWSQLGSRREVEKVPAGVDYDLWLGPAPKRPYVPALFQLNWRHNFAYSGGMISDWGAHHLDIVQWALGKDASGPKRVEIRSVTLPAETELYNTAPDYNFDVVYDNGVRVNVSNAHPNGITFHGEDGRSLFVNRNELTTTPAELRRQKIEDGEIKLYESKLHERNFVDGIYSGQETITPIEVGHRSITIAHLANVAIRLGRSSVEWDPSTETFVNDDKANELLHRPSRWRYRV